MEKVPTQLQGTNKNCRIGLYSNGFKNSGNQIINIQEVSFGDGLIKTNTVLKEVREHKKDF